MLYFSVDPRDGGPSGAVCGSCCCKSIALRIGETNLIEINYAPWSVPIGGPGIVPTLEYSMEKNSENCPTGSIDGFVPPDAPAVASTTAPINTPVTADFSTGVTPVGNSFTYEILPLFGPFHGTITAFDPLTGFFTYTPNNSYAGWDNLWYRVTDAQGRWIVRPAIISVGGGLGAPPREMIAQEPIIDVSRIVTNQCYQTVRFAIYMPPICRPCDEYRLTIRQPAVDCDRNRFNHLSCYDIRCRDCGTC